MLNSGQHRKRKVIQNFGGIVISILILIAAVPGKAAPEGKGEVMGMTPPRDKAGIFAPGSVSTGLIERDTALSPRGDHFFYSILMGNRGFIIHIKKEQGKWLPPEVASFSGTYSDLEPSFSADGKRLFFVSNRPLSGPGAPKRDFDIWYVDKTESGWGAPQNPGAPLNTEANEFYPSPTRDGSLYFCSRRKGSIGGEDIFKSRRIEDRYAEPENVGKMINTKRDEFNAFVAADESFIIYTTSGRGNGFGGGDLWINFRNTDGSWSEAVNMGPTVNSAALDYCPFVTADGRHLFFSSRRGDIPPYSEEPLTMKTLQQIAAGPGNGNDDIYWIDGQIIHQLKQTITP